MCELKQTIEKCRHGDRKAAEKIYRMFSAGMFAVCLRYSANRQEAEDALQDGFIRVFEALEQYRGEGSFEGWMKRIFINVALGRYRRRRETASLDEVPETAETEDLEDGVCIPPEVLGDFVSGLPERYRLVFNLYVMEGLPHRDIAMALGISEGTSKSNLARAREILKRKIKEYLENGE